MEMQMFRMKPGNNLLERSIRIIIENQDEGGAYIASPNFTVYNYSWFRDGSYIAYAMDLFGVFNSSWLFHNWCASVINKRKNKIINTISKIKSNCNLDQSDLLHTRYCLNGEDGTEEWENFQLDGFGVWLWSLRQHVIISKNELSSEILQAVESVIQYLIALWKTPCYDLWEENPDTIHIYTLASICSGLISAQDITGKNYSSAITAIKDFLFTKGIHNDHFIKHINSEKVDSSLLALSIPYELVSIDNSVMKNTVGKIEKDLLTAGGLHRFRDDSYYGGGEWPLLTAWLGLYYARNGECNKAREMKELVRLKADSQGQLPEQIPNELFFKDNYDYWFMRWGPIAKPLLWSHAMYIILCNKIEEWC